jgi:adenylate cyclase
MPVEIERKFLLSDEGWRAVVSRSEKIIDGLFIAAEGRKARVRLYPDRATLTLKGARDELARAEYEYEIPSADAAELIASHCGDHVVVKTRHHVPHGGRVWQIDEYEGLLAGVVIAEIEVECENASVDLPEWIGAEVSHDPTYRKINLLSARLAETADSRIAAPPGAPESAIRRFSPACLSAPA